MKKINNNSKIVKSKPKRIVKDKLVPCNSFVNEDFIKVRPAENNTTYLIANRVEFVDVVKVVYDNGEKPDIKHAHWGLNYSLINGEEILDTTPYKTKEKAELIAENLIRKLPKAVPITTITNNIATPPQEEPIYEENPNRQPVGFKLGEE